MADAVIDAYDAALFDLDGVVYRYPVPVPSAPQTLAQLRARTKGVGFITNNAAREPEVICSDLERMGIAAAPQDVATSGQAVAALMASELAPGSAVLVVGSVSLAREIMAVGLRPVTRNGDHPAAIVQGYDPDLSWPLVSQACLALCDGVAWYASNLDMLRPTSEGLLPGAGAQVAALQACFPGRTVRVAGKPFPPLFTLMAGRLGATHAIAVGDRLDTDIQGATNAGMDSLFVLTGAHGKTELVAAVPEQRPTRLGYDLSDLLRPERRAVQMETSSAWRCGQVSATVGPDGVARLDGRLDDLSQQVDALWALAHLCWDNPGIDSAGALRQLDQVR